MKSCFIIDDTRRADHGKLDRVYLRTCAVYKLFKAGRVDHARAVELLEERGVGPSVAGIWARMFERNKMIGA